MNNQRVVKFRVWEKSNVFGEASGRWHCPENQHQVWEPSADRRNDSYIYSQFGDNGRFIIQQFTGLQDRNGRDIYEGDVLNTKAARWQVIFENGAFVAKWIMGLEPSLGPDVRHNLSALLEHAILIGNVCENPELVKENTL